MVVARDYSTISPSAKALLLVRAQTDLPFAKEAAALLLGEAAAAASAASDPAHEARRRHFELRARSLDEALAAERPPIVLEIAAGYSFRGLAMAAREAVTYVDTDLPDVAAIKADLVPRLDPGPLRGLLTVRALDALDPVAFRETVSELPAGPVAILHEGLLMYLDDEEKARLASSVREALLARGGVWITADVYVRSDVHLPRDEKTQRFVTEHRLEEKKFADHAAAEVFFTSQGFVVERRLAPPGDSWHVRQTWTMRARP
jgi:O-methyltransferase involved in polyketide biosynthesis